jgi:hypothetical protein
MTIGFATSQSTAMIEKATNGAPGARRISLERRFPKVVASSALALSW